MQTTYHPFNSVCMHGIPAPWCIFACFFFIFFFNIFFILFLFSFFLFVDYMRCENIIFFLLFRIKTGKYEKCYKRYKKYIHFNIIFFNFSFFCGCEINESFGFVSNYKIQLKCNIFNYFYLFFSNFCIGCFTNWQYCHRSEEIYKTVILQHKGVENVNVLKIKGLKLLFNCYYRSI